MSHAETSYPLSPMQQGMLFHSLYAPHSGVDILQLVCGLREEVDAAALEQGWQRAVARHDVLRTSFRWQGSDEPVQVVHGAAALPFEEHDWRGLPAAAREERLASFLEADRRRGFELAQAPLARLALFRTAEAEARLVWTVHHALLDGRSLPLVLGEAFALYEAARRGEDLQLAPPRPYRDHIEWLGRQDFAASEGFWRDALAGFTAPTPLAVARAAPPGAEETGHATEEARLSPGLTSALGSMAYGHQLTLNTLVQGAWALLLSRTSGESDVAFAATRACRRSTVEGAESMVGLFINTLPLRVRADGDAALLPWLGDLRAQWLALRPHEHTPLTRVQGWSDVPRGEPLFESLVVFDTGDLNHALRALGESWRDRDVRLLGQTNFPLNLEAYGGPELRLALEYDRQRFDRPAIRRMLGHLETLLGAMAASPGLRLRDLPLLTPAEHQQILVEWNSRTADFPEDACIHELFERQAAARPGTVAVVADGRQLTYGELNARANQLARYLMRLGIGPETLVAICVDRSLEMLVGLLGILKTGGAYVPLIPDEPAERRALMLEDAQCPILVSQEKLLPGLPARKMPILCLDADWATIARQSDADPASGVEPRHLAYVIYTSGSTGRPKGVMISHRNVVAFLHSYKHVTLDGEPRIGTSVAPFNFDTSVEEIWSPLCFGGTLHLIRPEHSADGERFARYLVDHGITTAYIAPALLPEVARHLAPMRDRLKLRCLITGLQPKTEAALQAFRDLSDSLRMLNAYGPTETTYGATAYEFHGTVDPDREVPIGLPFPNYQTYIVDAELRPVPVGVRGEILIGGVGLARGYLNQPELTAAKFIPSPFATEAGARLYRTGDYGRYLPDGNIEFLGRMDSQVKIRGYRVELGEVEAALAQHPAVREAVVLAREDEPGDRRLVAYVAPAPGRTLTVSELAGFLRQKVPSYMVPSAFVVLDALPRMANGKVDRRALPEPGRGRPALDGAFVAPRDSHEAALAAIWAEVLGLERVGVRDSFFELGGHSLAAMRLMARVRAAWQVEVPLSSLFAGPTIEAQAAALLEKMAESLPPQD